MISAEEWQLTSFFESNPVFEYADDAWPYCDAVYECKTAGSEIRFEINPSYKDVTLFIRHSGFRFEFSALALRDVRYSVEDGKEILELQITRHLSILLQLRPAVSIRQRRSGSRESQYED